MGSSDGLAGWEIVKRKDNVYHNIERVVENTRQNRGGNKGEGEERRS